MTRTRQNILHLIIIAIVLVAIFALRPTVNITAHGVLLPTGTSFSATSADNVKVTDQMPVDNYTVVGRVNTGIHYANTSKKSNIANYEADLTYAKKLAAKAGANLLVIHTVGSVPGEESGGVGPLDRFVIYAEAVKLGSIAKS